jgi:hypothetical protein
VYTAYNVASFNVANRTIANAINNYQIPAGGVFYGGAHAMAITGVRTDVEPVANAPYTILGFYVDDPWNGYAIARNLPANQRGLRKHQLVSNVPRGALPSRWAQKFNPSPGEPGEGAYAAGIGYKFVVEPQGPEPLDDGVFPSDPPPVPQLPTDLNATDALVLAQALLASDAYLSSKYGLSGGGFDSAGMALLNPAGENDWFIPYKRGTDYTGVFLLSADYGILEEASWDEAGDLSSDLNDLLQQYQGIEDGYHPDDNPVNIPEPASYVLALAIVFAFGHGRRRR